MIIEAQSSINEEITKLRAELSEIRRKCIYSTRNSNYKDVAYWTIKASALNTRIFDLETKLMAE